MKAHRLMALLCAGILVLSPAGGQLAYAAEAQETSASEVEITEIEEDPEEGASTSADTGGTSTTENGGIDPKNLEGDDRDEAAAGSTSTTAPETEESTIEDSATDETPQTEDSVTGETSDHEEAQNAERKRLFKILEDLVIWENSNNEEVLKAAKNGANCFPRSS